MVFHIVARRSRGASHRKAHTPSQDACRAAHVPALAGAAGMVIGAIADGGGSRPLSHIGARLTVSLAISSMRASWSAESMQRASADELEQYWRTLCEDSRRLLHLEAEARGLTDNDNDGAAGVGAFACTLVAFMATRDRCTAAQVGDGFLVLGRPQPRPVADAQARSAYSLAFQNRATERAGEVVWLTASTWESDFRSNIFDGPFDMIIASSDGMENAVLQASTETDSLQPHARYFEQLHEGCRQTLLDNHGSDGGGEAALAEYLSAVLASPRLDERTDDDKSFALAVWLEEPAK